MTQRARLPPEQRHAKLQLARARYSSLQLALALWFQSIEAEVCRLSNRPAFGNIVPRPAQNLIGTPRVPRGTITHTCARMRACSRRRLDRVIKTYCPIQQLLTLNVCQSMSEYSSKQVHARTHAQEARLRRNTAPISAHVYLLYTSAGDVRMRQRGKGFAAHLRLLYLTLESFVAR